MNCFLKKSAAQDTELQCGHHAASRSCPDLKIKAKTSKAAFLKAQCKKCVVHLMQIPKYPQIISFSTFLPFNISSSWGKAKDVCIIYIYMSHICAFSISNSTLSNLSKSWMRSHSTVRLAASAACRRWWHLLRRVARRARPGWRSWRQRAEPELRCHGKRWCFCVNA